ncbi:MAG: hypothetical protein HGB26_01950 [Desulfobulbaceae bacterium]|nr:hypothetical protein [Desulfobulbaceae bacterium]
MKDIDYDLIKIGGESEEQILQKSLTDLGVWGEMIDEFIAPRGKKIYENGDIFLCVIYNSVSGTVANDKVQRALRVLQYNNVWKKRNFTLQVINQELFDLPHGLSPNPFQNRRTKEIDFVSRIEPWLRPPEDKEELFKKKDITDPQQRRIMTAPFGTNRRVRGPAGSGKSLVLAGRIVELLKKDKTILVATYNITLIEYLQKLAKEIGGVSVASNPNILWYNYHQWCKFICHKFGRMMDYKDVWRNNSNKDDILNHKIPKLVQSIIDSNDIGENAKVDAILVDEGQDYRLEWWNNLRGFTVSTGDKLLMADVAQDIYGVAEEKIHWTEKSMMQAGFSGPWMILDGSYRLPASFLPYVVDFGKIFMDPDYKAPNEARNLSLMDKVSMKWIQVLSGRGTLICVEEVKKMAELNMKEGVLDEPIVLISNKKAYGQAARNLLRAQTSYRIVDTYGENDEESQKLKRVFHSTPADIKCTTIHSFKGYESPSLVIFIDSSDVQPTDQLFYVAITRLSDSLSGSRITVVCDNTDYADYGETWPTYIEMNGRRVD